MVRWITFLLCRHPRWVLTAVLVVSLVAIWAAGRTEFDGSPLGVLQNDEPLFNRFEQLQQWSGGESGQCVILLKGEQLFSQPATQVFRRIVGRARETPGVVVVSSLMDIQVVEHLFQRRNLVPVEDAPLADYQQARQAALAHPVAVGHLVSPDGRAMLIFVQTEESGATNVVDALRKIVQEETANTSLSGGVTGHSAFGDLARQRSRWQAVSFLMVAIVGGLVTWCLLRSLFAALIVEAATVLSVLWLAGTAGWWLGRFQVLELALPAFAVAWSLLSAISLLAANRWRRADSDATAVSALAHALGRNLLSVVVVTAGYLPVLLVGLAAHGRLPAIVATWSWITASAPIAMLAATLAVLPLVAEGSRWQRASVTLTRSASMSATGQRGLRFLSMPATIVLVVAGVLASFQLQMKVRVTESFSRSSEAVRILTDLGDHFGGASYIYIDVALSDDLAAPSPRVIRALADVHQQLDEHPQTHHPLSLLNVLRCLPSALGEDSLIFRATMLPLVPSETVRRFVRSDGQRAVVRARASDAGSTDTSWRALQNRLDRLQAAHPGIELTLTGTPVIADRFLQDLRTFVIQGMLAAVVGVLVAQLLILRSMRLALAGLLAAAMPLAVVALVACFCQTPLSLAALLAAALVWGVALQQATCWLLTFRDNCRRGPLSRALPATVQTTGRVCGVASIILLVQLACGLFPDVTATREFAVVGVLGLLLNGLGIRFVLPALVTTGGFGVEPLSS